MWHTPWALNRKKYEQRLSISNWRKVLILMKAVIIQHISSFFRKYSHPYIEIYSCLIYLYRFCMLVMQGSFTFRVFIPRNTRLYIYVKGILSLRGSFKTLKTNDDIIQDQWCLLQLMEEKPSCYIGLRNKTTNEDKKYGYVIISSNCIVEINANCIVLRT